MAGWSCERQCVGRIVHRDGADLSFREPLAPHSGNDVLENVAIAVPAIGDKPVLCEDVLRDHNSVAIARVGDAPDEVSRCASLGMSISARG